MKESTRGDFWERGSSTGRSQSEYIAKEETSSPKWNQKKLCWCTIDPNNCYIVFTEITGTLLHCDIYEMMNMQHKGTIAILILKSKPSLYRKHIWHVQKTCTAVSSFRSHATLYVNESNET